MINPKQILADYKANKLSVRVIARRYGVTPGEVCRIANSHGLHKQSKAAHGTQKRKTDADSYTEFNEPALRLLTNIIDKGCECFWMKRGFAPGTYPDYKAFNTFDCRGGKPV